jgi:hypothetical protein
VTIIPPPPLGLWAPFESNSARIFLILGELEQLQEVSAYAPTKPSLKKDVFNNHYICV